MITIGFGMWKPPHGVNESVDYAAQDKFQSIPSQPPHQVAEVKPRLSCKFLLFPTPPTEKKKNGIVILRFRQRKMRWAQTAIQDSAVAPATSTCSKVRSLGPPFSKGLSRLSSLPKDSVRCGLAWEKLCLPSCSFNKRPRYDAKGQMLTLDPWWQQEN